MPEPHDVLCMSCNTFLGQCHDEDCTENDHHTSQTDYCSECAEDRADLLNDEDEDEAERFLNHVRRVILERKRAAIVLRDLLTWAREMGSWDAKCWSKAAWLYADMTGDTQFVELAKNGTMLDEDVE